MNAPAATTNLSTLRKNQPNASGAISFPSLLEKSLGQIKHALPKHITAERLVRVALTAFRQQPLLAKAEPKSVLASVFIAAQLGLEIGVLGEAYLLPFWNNKDKRYDCQLIVGYQGYLKLARNSGQVLSIETHVIYEKDTYTLQYGLEPKFEHVPFLDGDPGAPRLVYCLARFKDGGSHLEVMTWNEIQKIKARSPSKDRDGVLKGPWISDEIEMGRKTAVRRAQKYWPKSIELATAAAHDGKPTELVLDASELFAQIGDVPEDPIEGTAKQIGAEGGGEQGGEADGAGAAVETGKPSPGESGGATAKPDEGNTPYPQQQEAIATGAAKTAAPTPAPSASRRKPAPALDLD